MSVEPHHVPQSFWWRRAEEGIRGASEVIFPANDHGAPDWQETEMVPRTLDYLTELPTRMRRLVMLMFIAIEFGAPFLLVGFGRFSRISIERRARVLESWKGHWFFLYRILADALKAQLCMMYLSHPSVQAHLGAFKTCMRPNDPLDLPVREDVYDADTANGLRPGIA